MMGMKIIWHIILGVANVLLAAVMLVSAYGGSVSPESSVIPALVAMMFPLMLPLMLIALVWSCFVSWKGVVFNLVVLMCCINPILRICPLNFDTEERIAKAPKGSTFSIMTYNVYLLWDVTGAKSPTNRTVDYIISSGCDIVAYQEAYDFGGSSYGGLSQEQFDRLKETYPYSAYGPDRELGVLSKYPIKRLPVKLADTNSFYLGCYEVNINGKPITLVNVHLQSLGLTPRDKEIYRNLTGGHKESMDTVRHALLHKLKDAFHARARQAIKVRHLLDDISGPVIVCGDFNDISGCYAMRAIQGHDMGDTYRMAGLGPAVTYHDNRFYFRIDHILYRGLTPLKCYVGDNPASDHYPVCAVFSTDAELHI